MAKAAENYLKMHHPSLHKKMYGKGGKVKEKYAGGGKIKKGYAGGGQVNKAQALQGVGDVVDAKLTPGEIVLNADQQSALEQELGQPIDGLMAKIGVPGFQEGGRVPNPTGWHGVGQHGYRSQEWLDQQQEKKDKSFAVAQNIEKERIATIKAAKAEALQRRLGHSPKSAPPLFNIEKYGLRGGGKVEKKKKVLSRYK
jgi:hypothetical protein